MNNSTKIFTALTFVLLLTTISSSGTTVTSENNNSNQNMFTNNEQSVTTEKAIEPTKEPKKNYTETELREKYCYGLNDLNKFDRIFLIRENFPELYEIKDSASKEFKEKWAEFIKEKSKNESHKTAKKFSELFFEEYTKVRKLDSKIVNESSVADGFVSFVFKIMDQKERPNIKYIRKTEVYNETQEYNFEEVEPNKIMLNLDSEEAHKLSDKIGKFSNNLDPKTEFEKGKRVLLDSSSEYLLFEIIKDGKTKLNFELEETLDIGDDEYKLVWVDVNRFYENNHRNKAFIRINADNWVSIKDDASKVKQVDFENLKYTCKKYEGHRRVFYKKVKKDN